LTRTNLTIDEAIITIIIFIHNIKNWMNW